jgi:abnormal spindle-like microcephaly-associated protein
VPAIDRADKIRNLEICFKHLSKEGLKLSSFRDGRIKPEDIVDGHRKNTLEMLWRLILHWKVGGLVNQDEIRTETDQLICNYVRKFKARPAFDMEVSLKSLTT